MKVAEATSTADVAAGKLQDAPIQSGGAPAVQKRDMTEAAIKQHIKESWTVSKHAERHFGSFSKYLEASTKKNANTFIDGDTLSRQKTLQATLHPTEDRNCNDEFRSQDTFEYSDLAVSVAEKVYAAVKEWLYQ